MRTSSLDQITKHTLDEQWLGKHGSSCMGFVALFSAANDEIYAFPLSSFIVFVGDARNPVTMARTGNRNSQHHHRLPSSSLLVWRERFLFFLRLRVTSLP
jgi:hypothetical protein